MPEDSPGSVVADVPNSSVIVLVGNILHKSATGQNTLPITYGIKGIKHNKNALVVANNAIVWENCRTQEMAFVSVQNAPEGFTAVIHNNLCVGPLRLTTSPKCEESGNLIFKTAVEVRFLDPARWDFHLKAGSLTIDNGVYSCSFGDFTLEPGHEYVHPARDEKHLGNDRLDVGACEFAADNRPWEWRDR